MKPKAKEFATLLPRVRELGRDPCVHFRSYPSQDAVTLCNMTGWDRGENGGDTKAAATCGACLGIVRYVASAARARAILDKRP